MNRTDEPRTTERLFRGYGPLIGFSAILLAVALFVPSVRSEVRTDSTGNIEPAPLPPESGGLASSSTVVDAGATTGVGTEGPDTGPTAGVAGANKERQGSAPQARGKSSGGVAGIGFCAGRAKQDPNDPYSPPCYTFSGDNRGATSPGVTADAVTISVRIQAFNNGVVDALSTLAGAKIAKESPQLIVDTINGIVDYFNRSYNFYGRKLKVVIWSGKGSVGKEILGGGQEGAETDALNVQTQIKAFADASAITPPYVDALARRKIVSVGAPYMSQEWLTQRRPFAWSPLTDCSTVVRTVGSYYLARLAGRPASLAGGDLQGKPRRAGIIAPDNSWYQECVNAGIKLIRDGGAGGELIMNEAYRLDLSQMAQQATSLIQKLKSNAVTTVVCGCDPILLSFLTAKAREQQYQPEWVETGVAFTDQDIVAEIFDQRVWNKAFGISFAGPSQPIRAGIGYRAFKAMRPGQEPSQAAELIYQNLLILAIGIQMAGPNLTPLSFEAGMFKYPVANGAYGQWTFGPGDYTGANDAKEIWWNSSARSVQTNEAGAWIDPMPGTRYPIGKFPPGEPKVG